MVIWLARGEAGLCSPGARRAGYYQPRRVSNGGGRPVAFRFRWFGCKTGGTMPAPPSHRRCTAMGLLDHLETQLAAFPRPTPNRPPTSPGRLPAPLRPPPPGHASPPPLCPRHCHQNGEVRLQIPVFRCGQCRRMAGGMTPWAMKCATRRFSKKTVTSPSVWPRQGLSYARAGNWVGCVKSTVCKWLEKAPLAAPELPPDGTLEMDGLWTRTRSGRTE